MEDDVKRASLWHRIMRHFGMCQCISKFDDSGYWAECIICGHGKETTFVSRAVMRSYSDLMEAHKQHNKLVESERHDKA